MYISNLEMQNNKNSEKIVIYHFSLSDLGK